MDRPDGVCTPVQRVLRWHHNKDRWVCTECGTATRKTQVCSSKASCSKHRAVWKVIHPSHFLARTFELGSGMPVLICLGCLAYATTRPVLLKAKRGKTRLASKMVKECFTTGIHADTKQVLKQPYRRVFPSPRSARRTRGAAPQAEPPPWRNPRPS